MGLFPQCIPFISYGNNPFTNHLIPHFQRDIRRPVERFVENWRPPQKDSIFQLQMILQPTVNITSDPAGGLMGKETSMGMESCGRLRNYDVHWRKLSRTQLKAMNEDYWRDRPKRSPKNSHVDFVVFHLSPWSCFVHYALCIHHLLLAIWWNKPFRTMTLKSSCAALKWIGTSVTPQQGMRSPSLMDALTCSNMILNHMVAKKLAR